MTSLEAGSSSGAASELVAGVDGLAVAVAEHRGEFDSNGRLPDDLFEQLAALGLFRLLLPSSVGEFLNLVPTV